MKRSHGKANVVQTKAFSERLEDAIARYHNNAITTAEVIQELIRLAKGYSRCAAAWRRRRPIARRNRFL